MTKPFKIPNYGGRDAFLLSRFIRIHPNQVAKVLTQDGKTYERGMGGNAIRTTPKKLSKKLRRRMKKNIKPSDKDLSELADAAARGSL